MEKVFLVVVDSQISEQSLRLLENRSREIKNQILVGVVGVEVEMVVVVVVVIVVMVIRDVVIGIVMVVVVVVVGTVVALS